MGSRQGVGATLEVPETTYGFTARDAPGPVDVELTPVAPGRWRATDARLPSGDPFRCMAFVEQRGSVFEVVQPGAGVVAAMVRVDGGRLGLRAGDRYSDGPAAPARRSGLAPMTAVVRAGLEYPAAGPVDLLPQIPGLMRGVRDLPGVVRVFAPTAGLVAWFRCPVTALIADGVSAQAWVTVGVDRHHPAAATIGLVRAYLHARLAEQGFDFVEVRVRIALLG